MELLAERGRIPESHDSPFCLRKQNSDGGNTSFLSGGWDLLLLPAGDEGSAGAALLSLPYG